MKTPKQKQQILRLKQHFIFFTINAFYFILIFRLFIVQILNHSSALEKIDKILTPRIHQGLRGNIFSNDNILLAGNKPTLVLQINKDQVKDKDYILFSISKIIVENNKLLLNFQKGIDKNIYNELTDQQTVLQNLNKIYDNSNTWVTLAKNIDISFEQKLKNLNIKALYITKNFTRFYPQGDLACFVLGFVGKDSEGFDKGYFGIEGAMDKTLSPKKDLYDKPLNGNDIYLTIDLNIQKIVTCKLKKALEKYEAQSGEVIVMDPKTGDILALVALPSYFPQFYKYYDQHIFPNPSLKALFEPGSTFKVLTLSGALDSKAVSLYTQCTKCSGPRVIDDYTIKTWNNTYHPNITMIDALIKSDNVAMIFAMEAMGKKKFLDYLQKFKIGEKIHIDLDEDSDSPMPSEKEWNHVKLATASFGQGIVTNSLQVIRAINVIANDGQMIRLNIIKKIYNPNTLEEKYKQTIVEQQVISKQTAEQVKKAMIGVVEPKKTKYCPNCAIDIAGKTGTAQIPDKNGGYLENATLASFVGFAPADNPKVIMYIKIYKPKTSPWGSTTALPLWFDIFKDIAPILDIKIN